MGIEKKGPVDYLVMFGGPILFLAIALWGISAFLGPPAPPNKIQMLRDGVVKVGMSERQVVDLVGEPKATIVKPSGGYSFRYQRSTWIPDRKQFVEEDGYVDFDEAGMVTGVALESRTPAYVKPDAGSTGGS